MALCLSIIHLTETWNCRSLLSTIEHSAMVAGSHQMGEFCTVSDQFNQESAHQKSWMHGHKCFLVSALVPQHCCFEDALLWVWGWQ